MGHAWREMYPGEAAQSDALWHRRDELLERIDGVPLSAFMATDLPALLLFLPNGPHEISRHELGHAELDIIESRLDEFEAGRG